MGNPPQSSLGEHRDLSPHRGPTAARGRLGTPGVGTQPRSSQIQRVLPQGRRKEDGNLGMLPEQRIHGPAGPLQAGTAPTPTGSSQKLKGRFGGGWERGGNCHEKKIHLPVSLGTAGSRGWKRRCRTRTGGQRDRGTEGQRSGRTPEQGSLPGTGTQTRRWVPNLGAAPPILGGNGSFGQFRERRRHRGAPINP